MRKIRILFLSTLILVLGMGAKADEGMWLPMLINQYNFATMQKMGLKLTAEQIYSVNQACLKDAIITLDHGGCTGSIISEKGLLITNHHCGYDAIADQSSVEKDYLTNGFWATRGEEELPLKKKSVSFLVRMDDVTAKVLANVKDGMTEQERENVIHKAIENLKSEAVKTSGLEASIESMLNGNQYYLFIYKTYNDVRMVGAPPSSIGKFGGDTDNWMWPRHTGDFCLLRVYSAANGEPAEYSKNNIPLKPKYFLPVSTAGVKEGDFSLIMGYPGSTDRYLTSDGIDLKLNQQNPAEILMKDAKMKILKSYMDKDDAIRIAYADSYAYLGNFWKKALTESAALINLKVVKQKAEKEKQFEEWALQNSVYKAAYGNVMRDMKNYYIELEKTKSREAETYLMEGVFNMSTMYFAFQVGEVASGLGTPDEKDLIQHNKELAKDFYKKFNLNVEKDVMVKLLEIIKEKVSSEYIPDVYATIEKEYKNDIRKFVDYIFEVSMFSSKDKLNAYLLAPTKDAIEKDMLYKTSISFLQAYMLTKITQMQLPYNIESLKRNYLAGLQLMNPSQKLYPDANSTMRLTYGTVKGYTDMDNKKFAFQTFLNGVMEKESTTNPEFFVSTKLKELYKTKDFGPYAQKGQMPVCFITTHDITGGNSGSPVINAKGELIGVAFDGNSEAMSSDIMYNPNLQRTIVADIRYVLFVIDKFAGQKYLIDEMKLVK